MITRIHAAALAHASVRTSKYHLRNSVTQPGSASKIQQAKAVQRSGVARAVDTVEIQKSGPTKQPPDIQSLPRRMSEALAKNDLLEVAALSEECPSSEIRNELFTMRNHDGSTLLHQAVWAKNPGAVAMLLYLGADPKVLDRQGLSLPYIAAMVEASSVLNLVLENQKVLEGLEDGLWRSPELVESALKQLDARNPASSDDIDHISSQLCGIKKLPYNNPQELQLYFSHLSSFDEGPFGARATQWNTSSFLLQRVRSLVAIATDPAKALGAEEAGRFEAGELRKLLAREISCELETLCTTRRNITLGRIEDPTLQEKVASGEARGVLNRVDNLEQGQEYSMLGGWAGHTTYQSFSWRTLEDGAEVLSFRLDNLGLGIDEHQREGASVKPRVINIPKGAWTKGDDDANLLRETVQGFVRDLLLIKTSPKSAENKNEMYDRLALFEAKLIAQYGPVVIRETDQSFRPRVRQTADNCVTENHNAGLAERLGTELSEAIIAAEYSMATERFFGMVNPQMLKHFKTNNDQRIAKNLSQDKVHG